MTTAFGSYIKHARKTAGLSLSEAAELIGCTKSHIWDLEQGKAGNPTIKTLAGLAVAYSESLSYLAELAAICAPGLRKRQITNEYVKARGKLRSSSINVGEYIDACTDD
jgi:transcriptional regulator with XRE-family HTH domain